jgi:hypothetical protein
LNAKGELIEIWVHGYAGDGKISEDGAGTGPDHYRDCYDEKTEVLTSEGFKYFKDISKDHILATVNLENQFIEYEKPFDLIRKKYIGEMIQIGGGKSQNTDICITPNHRMVVYHGDGGKIKTGPFIKQARDLNGNNKLMTRAKWKGIEYPDIYFEQIGIMKPCSIDAKTLAYFLG